MAFFTVPRGPAVARGPQARPVSMQHTPSGMESSSHKWQNFVAHNNSWQLVCSVISMLTLNYPGQIETCLPHIFSHKN